MIDCNSMIKLKNLNYALVKKINIEFNKVISLVGVTYRRGFGSDDWIYWQLIHR
jgi:hypothetical protein